jgi:hypothetical protein
VAIKAASVVGLAFDRRARRWSGHAQSEVTSDRLLGMAFTRGSFRISSLSAAMISSALRAFAITPPEPLDEPPIESTRFHRQRYDSAIEDQVDMMTNSP